MQPLRSLRRLTLPVTFAAIGLMASIGSAMAAPATARVPLNVRTGPSVHYARIDVLYRNEPVQTQNCNGGWCYITHTGPDGWVSANYLRFGGPVRPTPPPSPYPGHPYPGFPGFPGGPSHPGGPGGHGPGSPGPFAQVCVYSGPNYTGSRFCLTPPRSAAHFGRTWRNRISSVRIQGRANITLCAGPNYSGFCRTISSSEPALGPYLNDRAQSARVH